MNDNDLCRACLREGARDRKCPVCGDLSRAGLQRAAKSTLTFAELRQANLARLPEFKNSQGQPAHSEPDGSDWCLAQWSNATLGELGEAANIIKKIDRGDITLEEARPMLADELADVQTYLDLLAYRAGIDLGPATVRKWNAVSERVGSALRLGQGPTHYVHRNPANAVFVKTAEFFTTQGGLIEPWGKAWHPVTVDGDPDETLEDARRVGQQLLPPYGVTETTMIDRTVKERRP